MGGGFRCTQLLRVFPGGVTRESTTSPPRSWSGASTSPDGRSSSTDSGDAPDPAAPRGAGQYGGDEAICVSYESDEGGGGLGGGAWSGKICYGIVATLACWRHRARPGAAQSPKGDSNTFGSCLEYASATDDKCEGRCGC